MFRYLTLLVCLWGVQQQVSAATNNCHMREVDLCLVTMLISASDGLPANDEQIDKACEPIKEGFECLSNYTVDCFTPLLKEIFDAIAVEAKKAQAELCTRGTETRSRYLKNAPCLQKVVGNGKVRDHMNDMLVALKTSIEAPFKQRLPILCCGIQRLSGTMVKMVSDECGKSVLDDGSAFIGVPIEGIANMFCRGYEKGSSKCEGILPPEGTPFNGAESNNQLIRFIASAMESLP